MLARSRVRWSFSQLFLVRIIPFGDLLKQLEKPGLVELPILVDWCASDCINHGGVKHPGFGIVLSVFLPVRKFLSANIVEKEIERHHANRDRLLQRVTPVVFV